MRRLLARALKQKRGRTICRTVRGRRACVREKERRESCGNERKEHPQMRRRDCFLVARRLAPAAIVPTRREPPPSPAEGSSITPFRLSIFGPLLPYVCPSRTSFSLCVCAYSEPLRNVLNCWSIRMDNIKTGQDIFLL